MTDRDDYEDALCAQCNGSGEGQTDGSTCSACKGGGTVRWYGYASLENEADWNLRREREEGSW